MALPPSPIDSRACHLAPPLRITLPMRRRWVCLHFNFVSPPITNEFSWVIFLITLLLCCWHQPPSLFLQEALELATRIHSSRILLWKGRRWVLLFLPFASPPLPSLSHIQFSNRIAILLWHQQPSLFLQEILKPATCINSSRIPLIKGRGWVLLFFPFCFPPLPSLSHFQFSNWIAILSMASNAPPSLSPLLPLVRNQMKIQCHSMHFIVLPHVDASVGIGGGRASYVEHGAESARVREEESTLTGQEMECWVHLVPV